MKHKKVLMSVVIYQIVIRKCTIPVSTKQSYSYHRDWLCPEDQVSVRPIQVSILLHRTMPGKFIIIDVKYGAKQIFAGTYHWYTM